MYVQNLKNLFNELMLSIQNIHIPAVIEIVLISGVVYFILAGLLKSKAINLLKGLGVLSGFVVLCIIFKFTVILFLLERLASLAAIALVIIFQNDLRQGIEQLGRKFSLGTLKNNRKSSSIDHKIANEIATATFSMAKVKTGALILLQRLDSLSSIIDTGIRIDGKVSAALLINIFEKNTPLHDGAVVIIDDIVKAATCYLPLSEDPTISKSLGTRHRAALGISEETDCMTIVVSEETGKVRVIIDREIIDVNDEKRLVSLLLKYVYSNDNNKQNIFSIFLNKFRGE